MVVNQIVNPYLEMSNSFSFRLMKAGGEENAMESLVSFLQTMWN